jgi:predicted DNA-binding transcriptional regulator AlpA
MPRIRGTVVNASRFCCRRCKDDYRNEARRRSKNPPAAGTVAAGHEEQHERAHPSTEHVHVPHRGRLLILPREVFDAALERGREYLRSQPIADAGELLTIGEVREHTGFSRAWLYVLLDRGQFPRPALLSAPGKAHRIGWRAADVEQWLRERAARGP